MKRFPQDFTAISELDGGQLLGVDASGVGIAVPIDLIAEAGGGESPDLADYPKKADILTVVPSAPLTANTTLTNTAVNQTIFLGGTGQLTLDLPPVPAGKTISVQLINLTNSSARWVIRGAPNSGWTIHGRSNRTILPGQSLILGSVPANTDWYRVAGNPVTIAAELSSTTSVGPLTNNAFTTLNLTPGQQLTDADLSAHWYASGLYYFARDQVISFDTSIWSQSSAGEVDVGYYIAAPGSGGGSPGSRDFDRLDVHGTGFDKLIFSREAIRGSAGNCLYLCVRPIGIDNMVLTGSGLSTVLTVREHLL